MIPRDFRDEMATHVSRYHKRAETLPYRRLQIGRQYRVRSSEVVTTDRHAELALKDADADVH